MKKELAAVLLLAAILCVSLWSTGHLCRLLGELDAQAVSIGPAAAEGRWDEARAAFGALSQRWASAGGYTRVFLRHPDVEAVSDALCALHAALLTEDADACRTAVLLLRTQLSGILETERLTFGSIF